MSTSLELSPNQHPAMTQLCARSAPTLPRSSVFPTEIYERIVDLVYENPYNDLPAMTPEQANYLRLVTSALHSCARACRAWFPRSQACLYRSIRLGDLFSQRRWDAASKWSRAVLAHPNIASRVESMTVQGSDAYDMGRPSPLTIDGPEVSILSVMAGKSPSLRTLIVQEASLSVTSTSLGTISIFTRLVTLNLSWVTFANFAACRRLLCVFPGLKDLTLWEVRWRYWVPYGAMVYFMGNVPRVVRLSLGLFGMAVSVPSSCQCLI